MTEEKKVNEEAIFINDFVKTANNIIANLNDCVKQCSATKDWAEVSLKRLLGKLTIVKEEQQNTESQHD